METKNNSDLLEEARRAVLLNRWFGVYIPEEYEQLIINQECCSEEFMAKFVLSRRLLYQSEQLLVDKFAQSNPELLTKYIGQFGLCVPAQVKIVETKNVELIQDMFRLLSLREGSLREDVLQALVHLKDPKLLVKSLKDVNDISFRYTTFFEIFREGDLEMLEAVMSLRISDRLKYGTSPERWLFTDGTPEMINWYCEHWRPYDANIIALLNEDINDERVKKENEDIDSMSILTLLINRDITFPEAVLFAMVDKGYKDLLKLYYSKHGLSPQILAYYNNLHNFKQDVGLL